MERRERVWCTDEVEIVELSIRGREYDAKMLGVYTITAPGVETPYWEIEFKDGTKMVTTDIITIRFGKREKK